MRLYWIFCMFIAIISAVTIVESDEGLPMIRKSPSSPDTNLYVGMFQLNQKNRQEFIKMATTLSHYFKTYSIEIGFFDCEFLSYYSDEIQQKYCPGPSAFNGNVLVFNEAYFLYELGHDEIIQPLEIFSSNILEQQIQQTFDLAYLTTLESSTKFLQDLLEQEKGQQNVVLINFSQFDSNNRYSDPDRKELLETVYDYSRFIRFVFVYDREVFFQISRDFLGETGYENIHIFLCKSNNCELLSVSGSVNKERLMNLINRSESKNILNYSGSLEELINDETRGQSSLVIYFKASYEDVNLNKFKNLASALQEKDLSTVKFAVISSKNTTKDCVDGCVGIHVKHKNVFMLANFSSVNLETVYDRLVAYNSFETILRRNIQTKYEFLDSGLTQLKIKSELRSYFDVLTDKSYSKSLKSKRISIVLYYLPWEKDSLLGATSLIELAKNWTHNTQSLNPFALINCFDYSDYCSNHLNVNEFPSVGIFSNGDLIQRFYYVPETKIILEFFGIYLSNNLVELSSVALVDSFLMNGFQFDGDEILQNLLKYSIHSNNNNFKCRVILQVKTGGLDFDKLKARYPEIVFGLIDCDRTPEMCDCNAEACLHIQTTEIYFNIKFTHDYKISAEEAIEEYIEPRVKHFEDMFSDERSEHKLMVLLMLSVEDSKASSVFNCFYKLASMTSMRENFDFFYLDITNTSDASSNLLFEYAETFFSPAIVLLNSEYHSVKRFTGDLKDSQELSDFLLDHSNEKIKKFNNHDEF